MQSCTVRQSAKLRGKAEGKAPTKTIFYHRSCRAGFAAPGKAAALELRVARAECVRSVCEEDPIKGVELIRVVQVCCALRAVLCMLCSACCTLCTACCVLLHSVS